MQYIIYMNGNRICPKCNAMMIPIYFGEDAFYKCFDCKTRYKVTDLGMMDKEMVLEEMMPLQNQQ